MELPSGDELHHEDESLRRLARHLVRGSEADDLAQEAWLRALQSGGETVRDRAAWLRAVLRNLVRMSRRGESRRREREESAARSRAEPPEPSEAERRSTLEFLRSRIEALGEPYRSTLLERFFEERPIEEIAHRLGRTPATVRSQLKRGLDRLRADLRERYGRGRAWSAIVLAAGGERGRDLRRVSTTAAAPAAVVARVLLASLGIGAAGLILVLVLRGDGSAAARVPELAAARGAAPLAVPSGAAASAEREAGRAAAARVAESSSEPLVASPPDATEEPAASAGPAIAIAVRDPRGEPVAAAEIFVCGPPPGTTLELVGTTDEAGRFERRLAEADVSVVGAMGPRVIVLVSKAGWVRSPTYYVRPPEDGTRTLEVELEPGAARIRGVLRTETGEPLHPGTVRAGGMLKQREVSADVVEESALFQRQVESDGSFVVDGLGPGLCLVEAFARGRSPARQFVELAKGEEVRVDLDLEPGACVLGVVRDESGSEVPDATVRFEDLRVMYSTRSDAHGTFRLDDCLGGPRYLTATSPAHPGQAARVLLELSSDRETVWNPVLEDVPGVRLRLRDRAGAPLIGWPLIFLSSAPHAWTRRMVTDGSGEVLVPEAPPVPFYVHVYPGGRESSLPYLATIVHERVEPWDLVVPDAGGGLARLSGCWICADGKTVPDGEALVMQTSSGIEIRSALDPGTGCFSAAGLPAGEYELALSTRGGGLYVARSCTLAPGKDASVGALVVPAAGRVRLHGLSDRAQSTYSLDVWRIYGDVSSATPVLGGQDLPEELTLYPCVYVLAIHPPGRSPEPSIFKVFRVRSGETMTLDLSAAMREERLVRFYVPEANGGEVLHWRVADDRGGEQRGELTPLERGWYETRLVLEPGAHAFEGELDSGIRSSFSADVPSPRQGPIVVFGPPEAVAAAAALR